ncbi:hypothetical protein EJ08DRAFT_691086 [Tothia fuscella]|uniref:Telomeric single stranded DNA binding POT1/Cdc13 domain-containing protein n=1 Tax=Tothia fuscella TaxID=1048955 RepID=A0A9P4P1Y8_9PEZI|nr:hypothetical protein EJ08DRAFT_691086 [Tothia fuscella]
MELTPIAQLGPSLRNAGSRHIRAIVTIIWPYSSSTKTAALLLAEPDFRLRNKRGQVRVQFGGACAVQVGKFGISSGDEVILGLKGAVWVAATEGISTPGKSVDSELVFKRKLDLKISRAGQEVAQLDVNELSNSESASPSRSPSTPLDSTYAFATPALARLNGHSTPASSAFHRRARVSGGSLVDSPYDPFVSDRRKDGEPERKRVRRSWGSEGRWKLAEQMPSPAKGTSESRWLEEAERQSPEPPESPITRPVRDIHIPSTAAASATTSQIEEMKTQYTQELVDMVGGDTEEDTDMEEVGPSAPAAVKETPHIEGSLSPLWRSQFAVFRDAPRPQWKMAPEPSVEAGGDDIGDSTVVTSSPSSKEEFGFPNLSSDVEEEELNVTTAEEVEAQTASPEVVPLVVEHEDSMTSEQEKLATSEQKEPTRSQQGKPTISKQEKPTITVPAEPMVSNQADIDDLIDPALTEARFGASQMPPPPALPSIQTSGFGFGFGFGRPSALAPPSALPTSPRTPDLRPQQSASLPLPSPFPGDNLATSYMDAAPSSQIPGQLLSASGLGTPTVAPDHMFQFGFGFGSGGLVQDGLPFTLNAPETEKEDSMDTGENIQAQENDEVSYPQLGMAAPSALPYYHLQDRAEDALSDDGDPSTNDHRKDISIQPDMNEEELPHSDDAVANSVYDDFLHSEQAEERGFNQQTRAASEVVENRAQFSKASPFPSSVVSASQSPSRVVIDLSEEDVEDAPPTRSSGAVMIDLTASSSESEPSDVENEGGVIVEVDQVMDNDVVIPENDEMGDEESEEESEEDDNIEEDYDEQSDEEEANSDMGEFDEHDSEDEYDSEDQNPRFEAPPHADVSGSQEYPRAMPQYDGSFDDPADDPADEAASQSASQTVSAPAIVASPASSPSKSIASSATRRQAVIIDLGCSSNVEDDEVQVIKKEATLPPKAEQMSDSAMPDVEQSIKAEIKEETKLPVTRRPTVTFAPRVTRARAAAANADDSTQLEPQSSAPLAGSQTFRPPRLVTQDTFEGMIHSDGSITTTPPSNDDEMNSDDSRTTMMKYKDRRLQSLSPVDEEIPAVDDVYEMQVQPSYSPITSSPQLLESPTLASSPPEALFDLPEDEDEGRLYPDLSTFTDGQSFGNSVQQSHHVTTLQQSLVESNLPMTPDPSQQAFSQSAFQAAQQQNTLPPTPQLTHGTTYPSFTSSTQEEKEPTRATSKMEDHEEPLTQIKYRRSKQKSGRTSEIPSVLSPWFAPSRRASQKITSRSPLHVYETTNQESQTLRVEESLPVVKHEIGARRRYADSSFLTSSAEQSMLRHVRAELLATSQPVPEIKQKIAKETVEEDDEEVNSRLPSQFSFSQTQQTPSKGLLTSISYYTPIAQLITHINTPSSQSFDNTGLDVLAIISKKSTTPTRAEKGPRDYYTTFSITDPSFYPNSISVQVFRPWKAALPKAAKGDVILLRAFEVFSAKGSVGFGLRSNDDSAWCAWKWSTDQIPTGDDGDMTGLAMSGSFAGKTLREREEIRGPPVELGEEEREHVDVLRDWWCERVQEGGMKSSNGVGVLKGEDNVKAAL